MLIDSYYLVASSVAALIARFITYPLDTIKTRVQTRTKKHHTEYIPVPTTTAVPVTDSSTIRWQSFRSLFDGIGITLLFSVPALTVYLTCYEFIKTWLDSQYGVTSVSWLQRDSLLNHAISGCFAELSAGIFFTPMEVIKSQLQMLSAVNTNHHHYSSFDNSPHSNSYRRRVTTLSLAKTIAVTEGLVGFYRGYWITIAVFLPHSVTYFIVYEKLKFIFWSNPEDQTFAVYILCSAIAAAMGVLISTPLDIIKTRWQVSSQEQSYQGGPFQIAKQLYQLEGGWKAFTQGMGVRILWGIPATTINMSIFEWLMKLHNEQ
ncbi:mitochondrial carrier domain-containing protein [Mycotypha africana]|uniref:mitochondrial carrier domain-containing protein n=1 Tax=Mycotypha africana TaxID=64632 RepID=UPI002301D8D9|nr:mitochondrial carrier domain-containing protein [Mycotypha africana]KAI8969169.1 mitochondrial carrier domain-containing protein [Mycotypha africana]